MLSFLALAAAQPALPALTTQEQGAAVFTSWADHARLQPPALRSPAPPRGGADLLTGWKRGDLLLLEDEDGEWLAEAFVQVGSGNFDYITNSMTDGFYRYNEDTYDYVCILLLRDFGFFVAFYQPIANDIYGIGYDDITPNEVFDQDPTNSLDGLIFMNYEGLWSGNYESGRYVFGQEFGHRWGAFTDVQLSDSDGAALDSKALLGRDVAHWSYWLSTTNSPMEGNAWEDNGDGTWSTVHDAPSTYSDIDMYLMGFLPADQVGQQTFLMVSSDEQAASGKEPASSPVYFDCVSGFGSCAETTVAATPVPFGVEAITAAEGERVPDSTGSPREFKMGFIVLVLQGDDTSDAALDRVDTLRQTWERDWEEDARQSADLITSLDNSTAPDWGSVVEDTGPGDSEADSDPADSDGIAETDGPKEEADPKGCGCSAAQDLSGEASRAGLYGVGLLGLAAVARRRNSGI